jgi:hypothetical protein
MRRNPQENIMTTRAEQKQEAAERRNRWADIFRLRRDLIELGYMLRGGMSIDDATTQIGDMLNSPVLAIEELPTEAQSAR